MNDSTDTQSDNAARVIAKVENEMATQALVDSLVLSSETYPRTSVDAAVVERYAEAMKAGDEFPPIDVKAGTMLVLNGWHRVAACKSAGIAMIDYVERVVPEGMPDVLAAASFAAREGQPLQDTDAREVARRIYDADPDISVSEVARQLARPRKTVEGWLEDRVEARRVAEEHKRAVRRVLARMLSELGWKGKDIATHLGIAPNTVSKFMHGELAMHESLDEATLRDAIAAAPEDTKADLTTLADKWREELIFATWTDSERELLSELRNGETVVLNMRADAHARLWAWCEQSGYAVRIDRKSPWGNPFVLGDDGNRREVITKYADYYLPHKPKLLEQMPTLRGKALGCWCAPQDCHGHILAARSVSV